MMKDWREEKSFNLFIALFCFGIIAILCYAPIVSALTVSIPANLTGDPNALILAPVNISETVQSDSNNLIAYNIGFEFDPNVLEMTGIEYMGTLYTSDPNWGEGANTIFDAYDEDGKLNTAFMSQNTPISFTTNLFKIQFKILKAGPSAIIPFIECDENAPGSNVLCGATIIPGAVNAPSVVVEVTVTLDNITDPNNSPYGKVERSLCDPNDPNSNSAINEVVTKPVVIFPVDVRKAQPSLFCYLNDPNNTPIDPAKPMKIHAEYNPGSKVAQVGDAKSVVLKIQFSDPNGKEVTYNPDNNPNVPAIRIEIPLHKDLQDPNATPDQTLAKLVISADDADNPDLYPIWFISGNKAPQKFIPDGKNNTLDVREENGIWIAVINTTHASEWYNASNPAPAGETGDSGICFIGTALKR